MTPDIIAALEDIKLACEEAAYNCASCKPDCGPVKAINEIHSTVAAALSSPPAADQEAAYLIRKNGMYYRPNAQGYTISKAEAGRYTLEEAVLHSHPNGPDGPRDGITYEPAATPPAPALDGAREALVARIEQIERALMHGDDEEAMALTDLSDIRPLPRKNEAVRLALEDADGLERTAEEVDENGWQDWGGQMRQAAMRIRDLAALSSPSEGWSVPASSGANTAVNLLRETFQRWIDEGPDSQPHHKDGMRPWSTGDLKWLVEELSKVAPQPHDAEGESATVSREGELREAQQRVRNYLAERKRMGGNDPKRISTLQASSDREAVLLVADLDLLSTPATSTERGR